MYIYIKGPTPMYDMKTSGVLVSPLGFYQTRTNHSFKMDHNLSIAQWHRQK